MSIQPMRGANCGVAVVQDNASGHAYGIRHIQFPIEVAWLESCLELIAGGEPFRKLRHNVQRMWLT
jgi:hypothetical protein